MNKIVFLSLTLLLFYSASAQDKTASLKEYKKTFKTYGFSDPDPIAKMETIYPYFRFDGYTNESVNKEWKVVELENDLIKVMILPEIGGKIWAAWEKSTGKPFIYYNQVVKFRDVAMRGPWTSGGIEANYGIIGHTPNCATPMDYFTEKKEDGSVSCYIGTLDLLTQTYWTIEINLPKDKGYFTTRSFWNNSTPLEQPYYTWMNTGLKSTGNLEFVYPGTRYLGHGGEYADWEINPENGKNISFYENNNFGGYKSYHVFGKYTNFFGAYYHDEDFGMARYSLRDEKAGKKIWIWGLSQQGMIWEKLLSDTDGQYVEVQSGRLFNQAADESNFTPFKQLGFAPYTSDQWTEFWFPVKGTRGFVMANEYGALNLRNENGYLKIDFSPLQDIQDELNISEGTNKVYSKQVDLKALRNFSDSIRFSGNADNLAVKLGKNKIQYRSDPTDGVMSRPVKSPENFDWNSVFGLYVLGKEFIQQRYYTKAEEKLVAALEKDPNYLPALTDLAMLAYRNIDYNKSLAYARHALSIDTYDPAGNFYYGLANVQLGNVTDAKDGFDIASLSAEYRAAAHTELSKLYLREKDFEKALVYADKSLEVNSGNVDAYQVKAFVNRINNKKEAALESLAKLNTLTPLNHFIRFEKYRLENTAENKREFSARIRNELPHETYLQLADWYLSAGQPQESLEVLSLAPQTPEIYYWMAYLTHLLKGDASKLIEKANALSPELVFPFRSASADVLNWAISQTPDWKPKYYLALIHWSRNNTDRAKELIGQCAEPAFAPFYAVRAQLMNNESYADDLKRAAKIDPRQWRYGKLLADHFIEKGNNTEALNTALVYEKRFPGDFRLEMLLAKTLLLNKQYKASSDALGKTNILPYEGATDGRRLYREAWLMQAVEQIQNKKYKAALTSINKAKLWPENLGAGKPYDEDIDLRLEHYLEAQVYEKMGEKEKAAVKYDEIIASRKSGKPQINTFITAMALKKKQRADEAEKLLKTWKDEQPENALAQWAYAQYTGDPVTVNIEGNENFRILNELVKQ
jgi:Tfp pilus assembly protein PilF